MFCPISKSTAGVREHLSDDVLADVLAARSWGLRFALGFGLEIELHGSADQFLQGGFVDLFAFADVDGAADVSFEAGVEEA